MSFPGLLRPEKGRAPVPAQLPGQFFVLAYDWEAEVFILHVDDGDRSTYDLGDDIEAVQALFRARTNAVTGTLLQECRIDEMIDIARELGMAQYIPTAGELTDDRVLAILPRDAQGKGLKFDDDEDQTNWLYSPRRSRAL
jgi:BioD-like phosphotransacetylase family protein